MTFKNTFLCVVGSVAIGIAVASIGHLANVPREYTVIACLAVAIAYNAVLFID